MEYVIGFILVIIVIVIAALLFRKRLYDAVDYYENWKIDIMGRNVAAELTRVKELNVEGEAKEKFEDWKKEWDTILMDDLADVEEVLFDTEQAADRFRITTARKYIGTLEQMLIDVEKKIDQLLSESKELLQTEELNRKELESIEPKLAELRKQLSQNRYQYDRAAVRFESRLDAINEDINIYHELIAAGNYSEGTDVVQQMKARVTEIETDMEEFPELFKLCKHELPKQLDELFTGLKEMEDTGYYLAHLNMAKSIHEYQTRLIDFVILLEEEGIGEVKKSLPETERNIQEMYQSLEAEVLAKNFVDAKITNFNKSVNDLVKQFAKTMEQTEKLKQTYHFEDGDLEKYRSIEKSVSQLKEQRVNFVNKLSENKQAYTKLRDDLEKSMNQLQTVESEHELYHKQIQTLRKDEIAAREQLATLEDELNNIRRKLNQSNLPGVPNFIWSLLEDGTQKNERVHESLNKQPLDITNVQKSLNEAKSITESALEKTNIMLDQAYLTEQVIQYANRYRSSNAALAENLKESEQLFRKAEYELALEQAAGALEAIEPGALKKIEQLQASMPS